MIDQLETIRHEIATCGAGEGCYFWGCSDMRALFARVTELEAGLAEYGRHKLDCPQRQPHVRAGCPVCASRTTCTCGLAALAGEA